MHGSTVNSENDIIFSFILPLVVFSKAIFAKGLFKTRLRFSLVDFFVIFIGVVLLLWSGFGDALIGLGKTIRFFFFSIFFYFSSRIYFYNSKNPKIDFLGFFHGNLILSIFISFVALYWADDILSVYRLSVPGAHPIPFSIMLGASLLYCLFNLIYHYATRCYFLCIWHSGLLGFVGIVLVLSNTRGVIVSLIISFIVSIGFYLIKIRKTLVVSVKTFCCVAVLSFIGFAITNRYIDSLGMPLIRGLSLIFQEDKGESINTRLVAQGDAIYMFEDSAFLGVGTGNFGSYSLLEYPHNIFLEIGAENGIVGLFLLIIILSLGGLHLIKIFEVDEDMIFNLFLLSAIVYFFIEAQFSLAIWMNKFLFYIYGFIISCYQNYVVNSPCKTRSYNG